MVVFPQAKINLGLEILRKRDDGYHDIDSVFYPIPLHDALEAVPDASIRANRWHFSGLSIPGNPNDNLIAKAYRSLAAEVSLPLLEVFLHKAIPMGAGLGGGSSDAAFFLKLANGFAESPLSNERLKEIAAELGSDCAFFIDSTPSRATGRGEVLEPVECDLKGKKLLLLCPDLHISTAEAYRSINPESEVESPREIIGLPVEEWKGRLRNRFEESVFGIYPRLASLKSKLYQYGALYASMTGSGSALYGIYDEWPGEPEFDCQFFRIEL